ncbi:hypothetical protein ABG768_007550, partial [Culter alburnus]
QHRAVKYSSVSPSWQFEAKGAVIIRSQSSQEVGWGLGNVSPSSTPLFFSPFNLLSISLPQQKGISSAGELILPRHSGQDRSLSVHLSD